MHLHSGCHRIHAARRWLVAALLFLSTLIAPAEAQFSPRAQSAWIAAGAPTVTVGLEYRIQLGSAPLPDGTGPVSGDVPNFLATFAVHGGVTFIDVGVNDVSPTFLAQAGVLHRLPFMIDRVGLVIVGAARPRALAPALRAEAMNVAGLQLGWVWASHRNGPFVSVDIGLSFLCDLVGC